jgi:hypothetical protein
MAASHAPTVYEGSGSANAAKLSESGVRRAGQLARAAGDVGARPAAQLDQDVVDVHLHGSWAEAQATAGNVLLSKDRRP